MWVGALRTNTDQLGGRDSPTRQLTDLTAALGTQNTWFRQLVAKMTEGAPKSRPRHAGPSAKRGGTNRFAMLPRWSRSLFWARTLLAKCVTHSLTVMLRQLWRHVLTLLDNTRLDVSFGPTPKNDIRTLE